MPRTEALVLVHTSAEGRCRALRSRECAVEALQKARAEASATLAAAQTDALAQFKLMEQDPKLATFLMQLEALEKSVKKQTTLILDDSMGPFGLLRGLDSPLEEENSEK